MRTGILGLAIICAALSLSPSLDRKTLRSNSVKKASLLVPKTFIAAEPTVSHLNGHNVLCYELHIVNTGDASMELKRVQVIGGHSTAVLLTLAGMGLNAALKHFTSEEPAAQYADVIAPGEQVVSYMWVDLPNKVTAPKLIHHVLTVCQKGAKNFQFQTEEITVGQEAAEIESPLRGSNWLALNGPSNSSSHRRTFFPLTGNAEIPQRYAIDWLITDRNGRTSQGNPDKNESYFCYGQKVHAVASGVVTETKDYIPQNTPGAKTRAVPITLETIGGNHVIVNVGPGRYAFYAHLQPGSLRVRVGDHVEQGQVLGLLGNSGNSTEPHLHFHLIDHDSPLDGEGLPFAFQSYQLLGRGTRDRDGVKLNWLAKPRAVKREMPGENDIVQFAAEEQ